MSTDKPEPATEYDGLQVYNVSDGGAWIRVVASNYLEALRYALNEPSGEYWGDGFESGATFTIEMDAADVELSIDGEGTKTAAEWAERVTGVLSCSEY